MHCVVRGTGTPKDRDEVNKRDVYSYLSVCVYYERCNSCCLLCIVKARAKRQKLYTDVLRCLL